MDGEVGIDMPGEDALLFGAIFVWGLFLLPTVIWVVWVVVKMLRQPAEGAERTEGDGGSEPG